MKALKILAAGLLLILGAAGCNFFDDEDDEDFDLLCGAMQPLACLDSAVCTLDLVTSSQPSAGDFRCRAARGPCESGFRQATDGPKECESREGCDYFAEPCFCPPDPEILCFCAGGAPPSCSRS